MSTYTTYTGRLGAICDEILAEFNDTSRGIVKTDAELLRLVNLCKDDLAREGYFHDETALPTVSGTATQDILDTIPTFQELIGLYRSTDHFPLTRIDSTMKLELARKCLSSAGTPKFFYLNGSTLDLIPAPDSTAADTLTIHFRYRPANMTGLTADEQTSTPDGTTPEKVQQSRDSVFVYFALWKLYTRDRHAPNAPQFAANFMAMYERERASILGVDMSPTFQMRGHRA